jgi:hypothetical protein
MTTDLKALAEAGETPLLALLADIPADARMIYEHSPTHSQSIPVGVLAARCAAILRALADADANMPVVAAVRSVGLGAFGVQVVWQHGFPAISAKLCYQSDAQAAILAAVAAALKGAKP